MPQQDHDASALLKRLCVDDERLNAAPLIGRAERERAIWSSPRRLCRCWGRSAHSAGGGPYGSRGLRHLTEPSSTPRYMSRLDKMGREEILLSQGLYAMFPIRIELRDKYGIKLARSEEQLCFL